MGYLVSNYTPCLPLFLHLSPLRAGCSPHAFSSLCFSFPFSSSISTCFKSGSATPPAPMIPGFPRSFFFLQFNHLIQHTPQNIQLLNIPSTASSKPCLNSSFFSFVSELCVVSHRFLRCHFPSKEFPLKILARIICFPQPSIFALSVFNRHLLQSKLPSTPSLALQKPHIKLSLQTPGKITTLFPSYGLQQSSSA